MNYSVINNNCCYPMMAMSPFSTSFTAPGTQGGVGLSGPNEQLIAFSSGDSPLIVDLTYAVGLGFAELSVGLNAYQLGICIPVQGTLSNFEIAYTGLRTPSDEGQIRYTLIVNPSSNNDGFDYNILPSVQVFTGTLDVPELLEENQEISANRLITIPIGSIIVNPGYTIVLFVSTFVEGSFTEFDSLTVSASVHYTPT